MISFLRGLARTSLAAVAAGPFLATADAAWLPLPPLPDAEGFAGMFAGQSGGSLLAAGGANIRGDKWKADFQKKWYDTVFILKPEATAWQPAGKLPRPCAYGVSIPLPEGVLCIGGENSTGASDQVFLLRWKDDALQIEPFPALPFPLANACGAMIGRVVYVAGGREDGPTPKARHDFLALDLDHLRNGWRRLASWPGPERMLAAAGVLAGRFFLIGGVRLQADAEGKAVREYLQDAYSYRPDQGWSRIADLPYPVAAAPSPAPTLGSRLLLIGGDDGTLVHFQPIEQHPGFRRQILAYKMGKNGWTPSGEVPFSCVTAPVTPWKKGWAVVNGEARPRVRTNQVWLLQGQDP